MSEPTIESLHEAAWAAGYEIWDSTCYLGAITSIHAHAATLDKLHNRVDPLLIEAREIVAKDCEARGWLEAAKQYRAGAYDNSSCMCCTLAGLKRGMELAQQPTLNEVREWLAVAYEATECPRTATNVRGGYSGSVMVKSLHASITGARGDD